MSKSNQQFHVKRLTFSALSIALAIILSKITFLKLPQGGDITLFSMLFAMLPGYFYGPAYGFCTGVAYGMLKLFIDPYIYFPIQVIVDYPLAFGALGLCGFFHNSKFGLLKGLLLGTLGQYFFTVLSGCIFYSQFCWEGWNVLPYSLIYNSSAWVEIAITLIIISIPAISNAIKKVKEMAIS